MTDFQMRFEQLKLEYENKDAFERAAAFLSFYLQWAAALEMSDPEGAIQKYKCAEECQSTIGTFATGSGEGLVSMASLYGIKGKRAIVVERQAHSAKDGTLARKFLEEALSIWKAIQADPNGLGEDTPALKKITELSASLKKLK